MRRFRLGVLNFVRPESQLHVVGSDRLRPRCELATAEVKIRGMTPSAIPEIIFKPALTEICDSAINHRGAFRARPCSFFHENHRFLSRHGTCAFGGLGICAGVMQSGDPVLITPTAHTCQGDSAPTARMVKTFAEIWTRACAPSRTSQPMNRLAHNAMGAAREERTRIGVAMTERTA